MRFSVKFSIIFSILLHLWTLYCDLPAFEVSLYLLVGENSPMTHSLQLRVTV